MHLSHLSLTNFRNFARLDVDFPGGPVLLVGGNAQGKTSLLEAIYYMATFVSFHATNDRQLVSFLARAEPIVVTRIIGEFKSLNAGEESGHRLEIRLIQNGDGNNNTPRLRKEVLLDGRKRPMGEVVGAFNAVLFLPHMLRIVEGGPEERRRYLNLSLGQVLPLYAARLSAYNRALTQRNALLKQINERGGDPEQLDYWDERVADLGSHIIYDRIHAINAMERLAARTHSELTQNLEVLRFSYQPAFDPLPDRPAQIALPLDDPKDRTGVELGDVREGFLACLLSLRKEEIVRGVTTVGPHRDELRFLSNGVDLGTYGSRGQGRTAVMSLKLAEVAWMKEMTGEWPVLLLDEVLAELDSKRRSDLLTRLMESEQVILTTTDLDLFAQDFVNLSKIWQIHGGRITV